MAFVSAAVGSIGLQVLFDGPCDGPQTCFPIGRNGTGSRNDLTNVLRDLLSSAKGGLNRLSILRIALDLRVNFAAVAVEHPHGDGARRPISVGHKRNRANSVPGCGGEFANDVRLSVEKLNSVLHGPLSAHPPTFRRCRKAAFASPGYSIARPALELRPPTDAAPGAVVPEGSARRTSTSAQ